MDAAAITTLEDVFCFRAVGDGVEVLADGNIRPLPARRRSFPRGLQRLHDRLRVLELRLQLDVNELRQEVQSLIRTKSLLKTRLHLRKSQCRASVIATMDEYFRVFRHGLVDRLGLEDVRASTLRAEHRHRFLATAVDSTVSRDVIVCWEALSCRFDALVLTQVSTEFIGSVDAPAAISKGTLDVTRRSDSAWTQRGCRVLCWFDSDGWITRHDLDVDGITMPPRAMECRLSQPWVLNAACTRGSTSRECVVQDKARVECQQSVATEGCSRRSS